MKKMLFITNFVPTYADHFFDELSNQNEGWELTVIADTYTNSPVNQVHIASSYNLFSCQLKSFGGILYRNGLISKILKERPSIIIVYANPRDLSCFIVLLVAKFFRIKTASYGMFHKIGRLTFISRMLYRLFYYLSDHVLVYSKKGATVLYALGLRQKKITVVGNAVNEQLILKQNSSSAFTAANTRLDQNLSRFGTNIVLQVVRLSKIKNTLLLVEAAKIVVDACPDAMFIVVGEGEELEKFKYRISELGLAQSFHLMGAVYDEQILSKLFAVAKVSVVPSCIGLSLHHSFAYAVPVITDDSIQTQTSEFDIILDGINALTYESNNAEKLAECILKILYDDGLRLRLAENAFQTLLNGNGIADKARRFSMILS